MKNITVTIKGGLVQYIAKDFDEPINVIIIDRDCGGISPDEEPGYVHNFFSSHAVISEYCPRVEKDEEYVHAAQCEVAEADKRREVME